jgi:hypothetical protein
LAIVDGQEAMDTKEELSAAVVIGYRMEEGMSEWFAIVLDNTKL